MKQRAITVVAAVALVMMAAVYLRRPSSAPPGQPPLVTLSSVNFSEFETAFDADADGARLLLLLSPT